MTADGLRLTRAQRIVIAGAGMGGLAAALKLTAAGFDVVVVERQETPGGKMREVAIGDRRINAGPTVFTMRWVFDALLAECGVSLDDLVTFRKAGTLARHRWIGGAELDLMADVEESAARIAAFSNRDNAQGYLDFCADSARIFETLKSTYIAAQRPTMTDLVRRVGVHRITDLLALQPLRSMWSALGDYFSDPRLQQLFGRYATYCGSSPFRAPATLMLVAHVEQDGVQIVEGGMHALAAALARQAARQGATFRYGRSVARVERKGDAISGVILDDGTVLPASGLIFNGDISALAPLLGEGGEAVARPTPENGRSLSAVTFALEATVSGCQPAHHTVFFSDRYRSEFTDIFSRRAIPDVPTVYVCAPDRTDDGTARLSDGAPERLFALINAPANGDAGTRPSESEIETWLHHTTRMMADCGMTLTMTTDPVLAGSPTQFETLFPKSGGALYGPVNHGMLGSFRRSGATTSIKGLYLAGGSVHPGPGVPMAALSGILAAESLVADRASTRRFHPVGISGGMSTV